MSQLSPPTAAEHGLFVAAVRHLLAEGWRLRLMESRDASMALHYDEIGMDAVPMIVIHDRLRDVQHRVYPKSIQQAADFLVAARILPRDFGEVRRPLPRRVPKPIDFGKVVIEPVGRHAPAGVTS